MELIISRKKNKDFEMIPAGLYDCICIQIIDLGTQIFEYQGEVKTQRKIKITWELVNELMKDGRPFVISKEYGFSFHEKSNLTKDLISWRGKNFTDEELNRFNLFNLLGLACQINIIHSTNEKNGRTYAKISAILNKKKNFITEKTYNELLMLSLENFNEETFNKLPEFVQNKIKESPEYGKRYNTEIKEEKENEEIPF